MRRQRREQLRLLVRILFGMAAAGLAGILTALIEEPAEGSPPVPPDQQ